MLAVLGLWLAVSGGIHGAFAQDFDSSDPEISPFAEALDLEPHQRLITVLATNDIHGAVEPSRNKKGELSGGLSYFAGVVRSVREGLKQAYGSSRAGVLTLDGGDQFQGTLVSNYNEGQLVFAAMNEIGYDGIVPGNHDYDFGPIGWLDDQVTQDTEDKNPRGALERLVSQVEFPLLSANTFFKTASGSCSQTARPDFLKPYVIKQIAGVRVALIGLDNSSTPTMTTQANVSDLCFADLERSYLKVRESLEGKADVFIVLMHEGNTDNSNSASKFVQGLPAGKVDAVVAGHTHWVNNARVGSVPVIQSGSSTKMFGRIDLVWDVNEHKLVNQKMRAYGGITMFHDRCAPAARGFCKELTGQGVSYEGVAVAESTVIDGLIAEARRQVSPIAGMKLGVADGDLNPHRISENALANALTDGLRQLANADLAFLNAGGIRAPIEQGEITYEDLFEVLPFANHGIVMGPMSPEKLLTLLDRSVKTCGAYGALMQSGLKVQFERDCERASGTQIDDQARVLRVETLDGELVYEVGRGIVLPSGRSFQVATLDFLAAGGSGYNGFMGVPQLADLGIAREALADYYLESPAHFSARLDGRWKQVENSETH